MLFSFAHAVPSLLLWLGLGPLDAAALGMPMGKDGDSRAVDSQGSGRWSEDYGEAG